MKPIAQDSDVRFGRDSFSALPGLSGRSDRGLKRAPINHSVWPEQDAGKSLGRITDEMVSAYLDVNRNFRSIPLKEFMDDLEKNILLSCLRLTHGNQRNAAAVLGLKPTALFEKMRKHGINGRQIKLSEKLQVLHPRDQA